MTSHPSKSPVEIHPRKGNEILPLTVERLVFEMAGERLLDCLNFRLKIGLSSFIIGPNGAGKSLLLRLCHGLLQPSQGQIRWGGGTAIEQTQQQAMVFQRPVLLRRSVRANVEYVLSVNGISGIERQQRALVALQETGLAYLSKRQARVLSTGEQQLLTLARAWVLRPQVLFLDEPTSHLDPSATNKVENIIKRIRDSGTKIIMISHDIGQVKRLADEVLFLYRGRLLEQSPVDRFFRSPKSQEAKAFVEGKLLW